jgi:hypothetical protein
MMGKHFPNSLLELGPAFVQSAWSHITMQKGPPFPIVVLCVKNQMLVIVVSIGAVAISMLLDGMEMGNVSLMRAEGRQAHYYTEEAAAEVRALHTHTEKAAWGKERRGGSGSIRL